MNRLVAAQTFLAVYRTGSVTEAARQLGMTQPAAASGHIRSLETHLRRDLFTRAGRGLVPTRFAEALAQAIGGHIDGLDDALATSGRRAGVAGVVRIGGPTEFLGEQVLPQLSIQHELGVRLQVSFGLAADLLRRLEAGEFDLVIATVRGSGRVLAYDLLYRAEFILVGVPEFLPAIRNLSSDRRREAADALPWLAYSPGLPIVRRYLRHAFGIEPPKAPAMTVPDLTAILRCCLAGGGVSVLPTYLCAPHLKSGALTVLHSPAKPFGNDIHLARRRTPASSPATAFVRDRLLEIAAIW